jgi:hypothetical protein
MAQANRSSDTRKKKPDRTDSESYDLSSEDEDHAESDKDIKRINTSSSSLKGRKRSDSLHSSNSDVDTKTSADFNDSISTVNSAR